MAIITNYDNSAYANSSTLKSAPTSFLSLKLIRVAAEGKKAHPGHHLPSSSEQQHSQHQHSSRSSSSSASSEYTKI